jgi:multidrug transporter EmrE-like cation transporter
VADIYIPFWIGNYVAVSGTWTLGRVGAADFRLRRTAAAALEVMEVVLAPFRNRTTTGKGTKLTALRFKYSIGTADLATNGVDIAAAYALMPATGNNVAAATTLAGTWDTDHDTAAKRKTQGEHTATFTFTTPVFFNTVIGLMSVVFSIDGSASGVFDLRQIIGLATEVEE